MPLIQSKSKKAVSKNIEAEMDAGKPQKQSIAIALNVQRKNKRKKMADGGMAADLKEGKPEPKHQKLDFSDEEGMSMGAYDMRDEEKGRPGGNYAEGGEVEEHYASIADAILAKKREAAVPEGQVDLHENAEEEESSHYDNLNEEAAGKDIYDLDQLSPQPEDSNEHGDDIESDKHDHISAIRKKMKLKRGE